MTLGAVGTTQPLCGNKPAHYFHQLDFMEIRKVKKDARIAPDVFP